MHKVAIIIPCYNEEESITGVIHELRSLPVSNDFIIEPVVVNDCSTDNTLKVARSLSCTVLNLPVNLGIGGAVQTGFLFAQRNNFDIAIQLDGDGQHPSEQIRALIEPIMNGSADVTIGSRFLEKEGFQSTFLRRRGINYFRKVNKFLTGNIITDCTSGFRALNKHALEIVCQYYPDEYPEPEAVVLFSLNHLKIKEIPVIMRERQGGVSSIRSYKSIYYMIKVSLAMLFMYFKINLNGKRRAL